MTRIRSKDLNGQTLLQFSPSQHFWEMHRALLFPKNQTREFGVLAFADGAQAEKLR